MRHYDFTRIEEAADFLAELAKLTALCTTVSPRWRDISSEANRRAIELREFSAEIARPAPPFRRPAYTGPERRK